MMTNLCALPGLQGPSSSACPLRGGHGKSMKDAPRNILFLVFIVVLYGFVATSCSAEVIAGPKERKEIGRAHV